jgi:K+-sensing histidine kinase KdpD
VDDRESASSAAERPTNALELADDRPIVTDTTPPVATTRWLRILHGISEGTIAHLDLQEQLRDLLGRVREAMAVENAAILLVSDDGTHLTVYAARGPEEQVTGKVTIPMGRGVAGSIAASRKPRIIDDLSQVEVENPVLREVVTSLVGAPLMVGERVIGVIHVDSAQLRHFTEEDRQLLEVVASRVALAIEHSKLYEAERTARLQSEAVTQQLQALQAISDVVLEYAQLGELLRAILTRIQQALRVDNVAILLPTPEGQELTLYSVHGPEQAVMGNVHVPMGQGVAGTIAATRNPMVVDNLAADPVANPFLKEHFRSLLGVPLLAGGRLVGVLHVDSIQPRHFTDDELHLLEVVAERIAIAVNRARIYESTQRGLAEAETRAAELEATTERMDEFLGIASHELRTPLTSLNANVQMLAYWLGGQRGERDEETQADYAERAAQASAPLVRRSLSSIARLERLVADLLDASRVREKRLDLRLEPADLVAIVRDAVEAEQQAHPNRALRLDDVPMAPVVVMADADRIGQVVANYLSNALKFSLPDSPVAFVIQVKGDQARVDVTDQGVGIPEAEQAKIWDRFYRVESIEHQSGSRVGLGLGLYISRDIVERHGGCVGVRSTPGRGSTVWFELPLARGRRHGERASFE